MKAAHSIQQPSSTPRATAGLRAPRSRLRLLAVLCVVLVLAVLPATGSPLEDSGEDARTGSPSVFDSSLLVQARKALFDESDLAAARQKAGAVLEAKPITAAVRLEALFLEMEAAALQADYEAALDAALRLCELPGGQEDLRKAVAAARIVELAGRVTPDRKRFQASASGTLDLVAAETPLAGAPREDVLHCSPASAATQAGLLNDTVSTGLTGIAGAAGVEDNSLAAEAAYLRAAQKYWTGDYAGGALELERLTAEQVPAIANFLRYQIRKGRMRQSSEQPSGLAELLRSVLQKSPSALAARLELAQLAYDEGHVEEAFDELSRVLKAHPGLPGAQRLLGKIPSPEDPVDPTDQDLSPRPQQMRHQPPCQTLRRAAKFLSRQARYESPSEVRKILGWCAPDTLAEADSSTERPSAPVAQLQAASSVVSNPGPSS